MILTHSFHCIAVDGLLTTLSRALNPALSLLAMAVTLQRYVKRAILCVRGREDDGRELQGTAGGFECSESVGGRLVSAARARLIGKHAAATAVPLNTRFKDTFPN